MLTILFAILPIFLLILLGHLSVRRRLLSRDFWAEAERLVFYLLFPALLLSATAQAPLADLSLLPLALATFACLIVVSGLLVLTRRWISPDGPSFTSVFQGLIRPNTYLCFAVALALEGTPGIEAVAIAIAFYVPLVNLLSIIVLIRFGSSPTRNAAKVFFAVIKNPLMLAIFLGLALNASGIGLHGSLIGVLDILGRAALCLGLMAVGAGLDLAATRKSRGLVGLSVIGKLAILPLIALGSALLFGVDAEARAALVLLAGSPTAGASYIMARQMGGNAPLVANIITAQVAVALFSMPLLLVLLELVGG